MLPDALAAREPFAGAALVVAHPDDETIAAGGSLHLLPGLLLVHVTDGAPRGLGDALREGFATPKDYAAAREAELAAALRLSGAAPDRVRLGVVDQEASLTMGALAERLAGLFERHRTRAVLTHAYEGGHPDHDATAWAVHRAAARTGAAVFEFAGYHAAAGHTAMGSFLPGGTETVVRLPPVDAARRRAMLDCFHTQRDILSRFDPAVERFRPAPAYDFAAAPHPGTLNYESWGWELTGTRWRALARDASCAA